MKDLIKTTSILLVLCLTFSCVGIRSSNYSAVTIEDMKVTPLEEAKVYIDWGFHTTLASNPKQSIIDSAKSAHRKIFMEAIKESNCCEVVYARNEADIIIEGSFHNESSILGMYAATVSGFTFTAIPCWTNSKMRITAEISKGKITNTYEIKDSVFIAFWAPLVVVTPFYNAISIEKEVTKNLYKNLVLKMKKDGLFDK